MTAFHLLIMSTFLSAQSYYLSSNLWTFDEGSEFCQNHCNSELASIRNIIDVQQAADTINSAPILFTTETLFYIGLYSPQSSSIWSWTDSSSSAFDRWDSDQPDLPNNAKRCVVLDGSSSYFWNDVDCTTKRMALCNDCNGILNKYFIGASTNALWTDANTECSNTVPSSTLASMHFARDYEEMKDLCSIYTTHRAVDSEQNCWIGLYDPVPDDLFVDPAYLDGTTLDYGSTYGSYPWGDGQPQERDASYEYTVWLEGRWNFVLHDAGDDGNNRDPESICAMPSVLCDFDASCELNINPPSVAPPVTLTTYQWQNGDAILRMDLTLKMDFSQVLGTDPFVRVLLSKCIGISYAFDIEFFGGLHRLSTGLTWDATDITKSHRFASTPIATIDADTYYTLTITIERIGNDLSFNLLWNDVPSLSYLHRRSDFTVQVDIPDEWIDQAMNVHVNGVSGYVGLYSNILTHAKYLYISGTPVQIETIQVCATDNPTANPSTVPTNNPSKLPTANPSALPSRFPTNSPSKLPTGNPSALPSRFPTTNPSKLPTGNPSALPSRFPTMNPSNVPTVTPPTAPFNEGEANEHSTDSTVEDDSEEQSELVMDIMDNELFLPLVGVAAAFLVTTAVCGLCCLHQRRKNIRIDEKNTDIVQSGLQNTQAPAVSIQRMVAAEKQQKIVVGEQQKREQHDSEQESDSESLYEQVATTKGTDGGDC
eukprot:241517_1